MKAIRPRAAPTTSIAATCDATPVLCTPRAGATSACGANTGEAAFALLVAELVWGLAGGLAERTLGAAGATSNASASSDAGSAGGAAVEEALTVFTGVLTGAFAVVLAAGPWASMSA